MPDLFSTRSTASSFLWARLCFFFDSSPGFDTGTSPCYLSSLLASHNYFDGTLDPSSSASSFAQSPGIVRNKLGFPEDLYSSESLRRALTRSRRLVTPLAKFHHSICSGIALLSLPPGALSSLALGQHSGKRAANILHLTRKPSASQSF
ncbi:hypothetical protein LY76DRAFT_332172 [Colletotrichum caudatum]|nr:hypothetical protein LY76DRAFT_332172 [Colletotrichum caudatum]